MGASIYFVRGTNGAKMCWVLFPRWQDVFTVAIVRGSLFSLRVSCTCLRCSRYLLDLFFRTYHIVRYSKECRLPCRFLSPTRHSPVVILVFDVVLLSSLILYRTITRAVPSRNEGKN